MIPLVTASTARPTGNVTIRDDTAIYHHIYSARLVTYTVTEHEPNISEAPEDGGPGVRDILFVLSPDCGDVPDI